MKATGDSVSVSGPSDVSNMDTQREVTFVKDPETGCEYILLYSYGISPRYDASGTRVKGCKGF